MLYHRVSKFNNILNYNLHWTILVISRPKSTSVYFLIFSLHFFFFFFNFPLCKLSQFQRFDFSMNHIQYHRHNLSASPNLYSVEYRGLLRRQPRIENDQKTVTHNTSQYTPWNNSPLDKDPLSEFEIDPRTSWSLGNDVIIEPSRRT